MITTEAPTADSLDARPALPLAGIDWALVGPAVGLASLGILMIVSASGGASTASSVPFALRQGLGLLVGGGAAAVLVVLPYRVLRQATWPFYVASLVLLFLVIPLGTTVKGATRWLSLGIVQLQPSEIAKLALIGVMADYLANNRGRLRDFVGVALPGFGFLLPMLMLVILQRDFGTTAILLGLAGVQFLVAGLRWSHVAVCAAVSSALLAILVFVEPYRFTRVTEFMAPFKHETESGYQVVQGWIALATGGWTGTGLGAGVAQLGFVPEAHNDMIMAVVGEELGALGFVTVVALLVMLVWRCFQVALRAPDLFGMLAAAGVGTMLAAQAIINIGVVGGLLPAKGLVLPFVSYGASAAVVNVVAVAVVLKVALQTRLVNGSEGAPTPEPPTAPPTQAGEGRSTAGVPGEEG